MRTNSFIHLTAVCAVLLAGLLSACSIYDDNSKCSAGTLHFIYNADGTENVIDQYIDGATLFVFDAATGKPVFQTKLTKDQLTTPNGYALPYLDEGNYQAVVWGNNRNYTDVTGNDLASSTVGVRPDAQGVYTHADPLYRAIATFKIDHSTGRNRTEVVFASAHINLQVEVANFEAVYSKGISPVIRIENLGTNYTATGPLTPDRFGTFTPAVTLNEAEHRHTAKTPAYLFKNDNNIVISIYHPQTNELLERVALKEYMTRYNLSVEGKQERTIIVTIEFTPLGVVIRPPHWKETPISPDI